ncbi:uncharacterized protein FIBRA_06412 [Fibroporia radiculosa]|uniref:Aldehyde dehydrogenase domain-containing protein n=1 Tax=Fibroporia radiculosa TaxID=599839 RepID=J4GSP5_9APHY|nr:uncharacterized protein FIBRA_06412 [Fibroporia radiculosa]CCM04245.1 predicted protein [Fibroporia radiculosa]
MSTPFTPLYIDGEERQASDKGTFEVRNPYSKEIVTLAASASRDDCKDAIDAAAKAFRTWEHTPLITKRDYFLKAADLLETDKYKAKVAEAINAEAVAGEYMVQFNLMTSIGLLRWVAGSIALLRGETFPSLVPGGQVLAQRRAQGVIFSIAPWNAPLYLTFRALAIPIICGNTVVLKTSEVTPRTQHIITELFHEAGLPKGVLNFVHLSREDAPARTAEMIGHPAVRKITFTGSDTVGKIIAGEAAKYLKPCVIELGGKSPAIVLADGDIARAAKAITYGALLYSGQICMSTERVIVQREVAAELTEALIAEFSKLKAGGPGEALSAQFSEASAQNIVSMLHEAQSTGAEFLLGDGTRDGSVVQPHIVTGVKPGTRLWERETFGPVVVLIEADSIDEAVELANHSQYSLAGSVWTNSLNDAIDVSMRVVSASMGLRFIWKTPWI